MHDSLQKMRGDTFLPTFMYHKLLHEASQESLHMHDLLQEMGRNIVFQESPSDTGRRSRLWSLKDIDLVLKGNMGTKKVQSMVLDLHHHFEADWHPNCFSKMKNLKLLDLSRVHLSHNLNCLPRALKFLRWDSYALESLPSIDELYELESIQLCHSNIERLWNGTPYLYRLTNIDLSHSHKLEETPDFTGTPNLEKLLLNYCIYLVRVHESVGQLKKLVELSLRYCISLVTLPTWLDMNNLEVLILAECSKLEKLPEFGKSMRRLYFLDLRGTKITKIPLSIFHLNNLKYLDLSSWHILRSVPELPPNLFIRASDHPLLKSTSDLQDLIASCVSKSPIHLFSDCQRFHFNWGEGIPWWFKRQEHCHSKDSSGEVVTITIDIPCDVADYEGKRWAIAVCIVFECLSEAWRGFSMNWKFQDYCHPNYKSHKVDKISANAVFESRHYVGYDIDREDCRNYVGFYPIDKEGHCRQHPRAEIECRVYAGFYPIDRENCQPHPSGVGSQVDLTLCFPTTNTVDHVTVGSIKRYFRNLEIADCGWWLIRNKDFGASGSDFAEVGSCLNSDLLYELESLQLYKNSTIRGLWNGAPFLDKLRILDLKYCEFLIETSDFNGTPNLEKLSLVSCPKLVRVHESIGQLKKLVLLKFESCENLVTLPSHLEMESLEEIILSECERLENLPEFGTTMRNLHVLSLNSTSIIEIPSSITHLINLKYLHLDFCGKLKSIPELPRNLFIYASHCPLLEPTSAVTHLFASDVSKGPVHVLGVFYRNYKFPRNQKLSRCFEQRRYHWSRDSSGEVMVTIRADIPCDVADYDEGECWAIVVCILFKGSYRWGDFSINWKFQDYCHSNYKRIHISRFRSANRHGRSYVGFYPIDKEHCRPHSSGVGSQVDLTLCFPTTESDSMEIMACGWRLDRKKDFDAGTYGIRQLLSKRRRFT